MAYYTIRHSVVAPVACTWAATARPSSKRKFGTSQLRNFDAGRELSLIGYSGAKCHHGRDDDFLFGLWRYGNLILGSTHVTLAAGDSLIGAQAE